LVDLRRAPWVDSAGVRALLQLQEELRAGDGELRLLLQPGSRVERTLSLLRLTPLFAR
jgi:anti-anti-sigma regulatory factor